MRWNDWLRVCAWRALEEGDVEGGLVSVQARTEATTRCAGELVSDEVSAGRDAAGMMRFLRDRARVLDADITTQSVQLGALRRRLMVPKIHWALALAGWGGAVVLGFGMTELGQAGELNLLALPLVGILLWNALVISLSLIVEFWPAGKDQGPAEATPPPKWLMWLAGVRADASEGGARAIVAERHQQLVWPVAFQRLWLRFRGWLHIAAALLALGSAAALYARGWAREYRAMWESTVLKDAGAQKFFGVLFTPASKVLGLELPLDEIPAMHRTGDTEVSGVPALPWIHLYAGTLLLGIIMPRLMLAIWVDRRAAAEIQQRMRALHWERYAARLLRATEGGDDRIPVWTHLPEASLTNGGGHSSEPLALKLREAMGGLLRLDWRTLIAGQEEEMLAAWVPDTPRAVLIFQLATTPEMEVQRALCAQVRAQLQGKFADAQLWVLLDARALASRWTPDRLAGREKLWRETLSGVVDELLTVGKEGPIVQPPLRKP
ncbi:MAG: hypothetical protein KDK97_04840 [Verrucomicrobiales bacterium]|nr:hypothetical protein [Verrucomicrobiales bacterium]MCP5560477.1 hypothetical protein [Verrucomicrobiaceae bacterium]